MQYYYPNPRLGKGWSFTGYNLPQQDVELTTKLAYKDPHWNWFVDSRSNAEEYALDSLRESVATVQTFAGREQ